MLLSRAQARAVDERALVEFGIPGSLLMENAGAAAARLLLSFGTPENVLVCCGKGNNGGDGFVVARHLACAGVPVTVAVFADPTSLQGDAALNWNILTKLAIPTRVQPSLDSLEQYTGAASWVVDGLFGTGLMGPVRSPVDQVITLLNASRRPVLALDIPSGLDCDTGEPLGATIRAAHTITFVAPKLGFGSKAAREFLGTLHVAGIGMPLTALVNSDPNQRTTA